MAKPTLEIRFPPPPTEVMHRALNFIEDVDRDARSQGIGAVDDIDHYGSGMFVVRIVASRHLGTMSSMIAKLLRQHMLEGYAIVERSDRAKASDRRNA
jgi:hypothetical protein